VFRADVTPSCRILRNRLQVRSTGDPRHHRRIQGVIHNPAAGIEDDDIAGQQQTDLSEVSISSARFASSGVTRPKERFTVGTSTAKQ